MTMGDRIVILNDGSLQQLGDPKTVYDDPVNEFVGGFIGSPSMNFLDVSVEGSGRSVTLRTADGAAYELSPSLSERVTERTDADRLTLGIRPEDVRTADPGREEAVRTSLEVLEPVGSDNYLYLALGEDFIARVDAVVEPDVGETVSVTFDESKIHLFEADTGESIFYDGEVEDPVAPTP